MVLKFNYIIIFGLISFLNGCGTHSGTSVALDEDQQEFILSKANNYQGLLKLYRNKLSRNDNPRDRLKLSEYYFKVEDYSSSLHFLEPLLTDSKDDAVYFLQAQNLTELGHNDQALIAAQKAMILNPKNGDAYNIAGVLEAENGNFDRAKSLFNSARSLFVPEEQVVNNLAMLMILEGKHQSAFEYLMPLYSRGHTTPLIIHNLVYVLVQLKDYEGARSIIRSNNLDENPEQLIASLRDLKTKIKKNDVGNFLTEPEPLQKKIAKANLDDGKLLPPVLQPSVQMASPKLPKPMETKPELRPIDPNLLSQLVQPPPPSQSTKSNKVVHTGFVRSAEVKYKVVDVRFGAHNGFSRLVFEADSIFKFELISSDDNKSLMILLKNAEASKNFYTIIKSVIAKAKSSKAFINDILISENDKTSLLIIVNLSKPVKANIRRLPHPGGKVDRLIIDFL